jgi:hypothetical protein
VVPPQYPYGHLPARRAGERRRIDDEDIDVRVDPSLAGRTVRNSASVASEPSGPLLQPAERIPSSNQDTADMDVAQTADLRITETVTPAVAAAAR